MGERKRKLFNNSDEEPLTPSTTETSATHTYHLSPKTATGTPKKKCRMERKQRPSLAGLVGTTAYNNNNNNKSSSYNNSNSYHNNSNNTTNEDNNNTNEDNHPYLYNLSAIVSSQVSVTCIVESLENSGLVIIDNFLNESLASVVARTTTQLHAQRPYYFVKSDTRYRTDYSYWACDSAQYEGYSQLDEIFVDLAKSLNQTYYHQTQHKHRPPHRGPQRRLKVTGKSKLQVSCFRRSSQGYLPHSDNPNDNGPMISLVYFPNERYELNDGAIKRFYLRQSAECVDVEPRYNRLVVHWSDSSVITETLPTNNSNVFTISTWFFGNRWMM